ncbi:hypothetical protein Poli38472_011509 [Pythium oligandrum]|uniref:Man1/Src1-like C-terminal domain-containing protein n=1 Tax=Pythium oligandrum TaxID=41045 RepID=A0A8K1CJB8_PYTOL|nr:hypothetical protein Poli38472_011509 [Pythium oligandrum]|eukprot:TMW64629.1 hypothetical protein Poli38472_011509 [Pythium oligandrum]
MERSTPTRRVGGSTPQSTRKLSSTSAASPGMRSPNGDFMSPVSRFNHAQEQAEEEQKVRMQALLDQERVQRLASKQGARVSTGNVSTTSSAKRKLLEPDVNQTPSQPNEGKTKHKKSRMSSPTRKPQQSMSAHRQRPASHGGNYTSVTHRTTVLSASALKRHEEREQDRYTSSPRSIKQEAVMMEQRYLAYESHTSVSTPTREHHSPVRESGFELFARHADPTVIKTPPKSPSSSPFRFTDDESSVASESPLPLLRTPIKTPPRAEDGMVDLGSVSKVSHLETVEGDDILSAMLGHTTPRVGRHFPSEHSRTTSEEREIQFLRRRRLAGNRPVVMRDVAKGSWEFEEALAPIPAGEKAAAERVRPSEDAQRARNDAEDAKAAAAENDALLEEDENDDDEPTERKIARFNEANHVGMTVFFLWVGGSIGLFCTLIVFFPWILTFFAPALPYCDGNGMALETGNPYALAVFDTSNLTALEQYSLERYREDCRSCPLNGVCQNGALVRCISPFELRRGVCVEAENVQLAVDHIAKSVEAFVRSKATQQVCGPPLLPLLRDNNWSLNLEALPSATQVVIILAELKEFMLSEFQVLLEKSSYSEVLANVSREEVLRRSLDLAFAGFEKIARVVGSVDEEMFIHIAASIAPWSCRARNQLLENVHLLGVGVFLAALCGLVYRKWLLYKSERALVARLVNEVRYFLIGRSQRTEPFYPANHLRDNLFDTLPNVSLKDRKWLRDAVWPKVSSIVAEDSRVRCRIAPIHGNQMVVWEWISSLPPRNVAAKMRRSHRKRYSI